MQCPADVPQFNKAIFSCCCPERASLLSSFARIGLKLDWSISSGFRGHYFSQHRLGHLRYYKGRWQRVKGRIEKNNRLQGLKRCKGTLFQFHMLVRYQCERTWLLTYNNDWKRLHFTSSQVLYAVHNTVNEMTQSRVKHLAGSLQQPAWPRCWQRRQSARGRHEQ